MLVHEDDHALASEEIQQTSEPDRPSALEPGPAKPIPDEQHHGVVLAEQKGRVLIKHALLPNLVRERQASELELAEMMPQQHAVTSTDLLFGHKQKNQKEQKSEQQQKKSVT